MIKTKTHWFGKILASTWLISILMLSFGLNQAFVSDMRDMQARVGLLHRPTTKAMDWKIDNFIKSLFTPVKTEAVQPVVCLDCLKEVTYTAQKVAEKIEITLLKSILSAFIKAVLSFIQDTVLNIISNLTKAQNQFNYLKTIGQYAEQAVLLGAKQAYNCANESASNWAYRLFGETPPPSDPDSCKFDIDLSQNPTDRDAVEAAQKYLDQCAVLTLGTVKPQGCTDSQIAEVEKQTAEIIKETVSIQCAQAYKPPLFEDLNGVYTCSDRIVEKISQVKEVSRQRVENIKQSADTTYTAFKNSLLLDQAAVITEDPIPTGNNFPDAGSSPSFFSTTLDVVDPATGDINNLKFALTKDPNTTPLINELVSTGILTNPQTSGEGIEQSLTDTIRDLFKQFLDQLFVKLQDTLFSFINGLIANLDLNSGGGGRFGNLLSEITGTVRTYAQTKVDNLYQDITAQKQAYLDSIGVQPPVCPGDPRC